MAVWQPYVAVTFGSKCQKDKVAGLGNGLKRMPVYVIYMAAACNHLVTWSVSVTRVNSHKFHANGVCVCVCDKPRRHSLWYARYSGLYRTKIRHNYHSLKYFST